jgi:hypothetical protein
MNLPEEADFAMIEKSQTNYDMIKRIYDFLSFLSRTRRVSWQSNVFYRVTFSFMSNKCYLICHHGIHGQLLIVVGRDYGYCWLIIAGHG